MRHLRRRIVAIVDEAQHHAWRGDGIDRGTDEVDGEVDPRVESWSPSAAQMTMVRMTDQAMTTAADPRQHLPLAQRLGAVSDDRLRGDNFFSGAQASDRCFVRRRGTYRGLGLLAATSDVDDHALAERRVLDIVADAQADLAAVDGAAPSGACPARSRPRLRARGGARRALVERSGARDGGRAAARHRRSRGR